MQLFISFILSFFELFGMDNGLIHLISLICNMVIYATFGFKHGKKSSKKGWIEGIIIGSILNTTLFLINIIFFRSLSWLSFIYYLVLLICSLIFAIIGKNKKEESIEDKN